MPLGPKRTINLSASYEPSVGHLATMSQVFVDAHTRETKEAIRLSRWNVSGFESCRETFHSKWKFTQENILFRNEKSEIEAVANFIWRVEGILETVKRTKIGPCNKAGYTWIHVSPFWLRHPMRRSFFTAALRAGRSYLPEKDNFEKALFSVTYFNNTQCVKNSVKRFLGGFTWYTGSIVGWYNAFYDKSDEQLEKLLVRPPHPIPKSF